MCAVRMRNAILRNHVRGERGQGEGTRRKRGKGTGGGNPEETGKGKVGEKRAESEIKKIAGTRRNEKKNRNIA